MVQPKRDGKDYASISGMTHMLNNTDSVLKKDDVKDAIEDYEELFAGARTEVRARICIPDSALPASCCDSNFVSNIYSLVVTFRSRISILHNHEPRRPLTPPKTC